MTRRPAARRPLRAAAAAALLCALALPAAAYLPPAGAILKRAAQRRTDAGAGASAFEVRGTMLLAGDAARRLAPSAAPGAAGIEVSLPATLVVKSPGKCRLELAPPGAVPAGRPAASVKAGRFTSRNGLDGVPAARALVEGVCALLGERGQEGLTQGLAARGVSLGEVALDRLGGRVAWVVGGRAKDARPQAWFEKATFQPVRLVAPVAGATLDLRLLDFGSPLGGDLFPRAAEVWDGKTLLGRFTTESVGTAARVPDSAF